MRLGDDDPIQWCSVDGETHYYRELKEENRPKHIN